MADLSHMFGFASEEAAAKRAEVDIWDRRLQQLARQYRAQGLSEEAAEERASRDVRREIQQS